MGFEKGNLALSGTRPVTKKNRRRGLREQAAGEFPAAEKRAAGLGLRLTQFSPIHYRVLGRLGTGEAWHVDGYPTTFTLIKPVWTAEPFDAVSLVKEHLPERWNLLDLVNAAAQVGACEVDEQEDVIQHRHGSERMPFDPTKIAAYTVPVG